MKRSPKVALIFDIDGVIRDVAGSYRRALADTVEHFTNGQYRPSAEDIDRLKAEGIWNNDWEASQELIKRYFAGLIPSAPFIKGEMLEHIRYETIVEFFQGRYRGTNPHHWDGYISQEPLIATPEYFQALTDANVAWGFFSGATRGSASYVLGRLAIESPVLVAMEDAPGKPDPAGLLKALEQLQDASSPHPEFLGGNDSLVIYVGDTVADMLTVLKARESDPSHRYMAVGVIPPHVQLSDPDAYADLLRSQGADLVLNTALELTPEKIREIL